MPSPALLRTAAALGERGLPDGRLMCHHPFWHSPGVRGSAAGWAGPCTFSVSFDHRSLCAQTRTELQALIASRMARRIHATSLYASASNKRIGVFLGAGFLLGLALGYVAMGTLHAFFEIGAERHHGQEVRAVEKAGAAAKARAAKQAAATSVQRQHKQQKRQEEAAAAAEQGAAAQQQAEAAGGWPTKGNTIHVLCTSNGSPYLNFQTRIMYATFKLAQAMPGGENMVAFTRILHRTKPDVLMEEVPTFRSNPLTPQCDEWCEYPVSDRPNAVRQFFDAVRADPSMAKAPWMYMIETDYVWMKPLQAPWAEKPEHSVLFPFGYIQPTHPNAEATMRKFYPERKGPLTDIPNSGPAPALLRVDEWFKVMPLWESIAAKIEADPESVKALGWVREMYAFSLAMALTRIPVDLTPPPHSRLISQPPADHTMGEASAAHYTWGSIIKDADGKDVWQFDKRTYTGKELETHTPYITEPPPLKEGWRLQDGMPVDEDLHATLLAMIQQMNRGIYTLKDIPV